MLEQIMNKDNQFIALLVGGFFLVLFIAYKLMSRGEGNSHSKKLSKRENHTYICNKEIINVLSEYVEEHKTMPFGKILLDLGVIETGYRENKKPYTINPAGNSSRTILKRINYRTIEHELSEDCT